MSGTLFEPPEWFTTNVDRSPRHRWTTLDGLRLHGLEWGADDAPLLVLVHGAAAHAGWWSPIAPFLADDGWRVLAVDLSGHGDSDRRDLYRIEQWADEIAAAVRDETAIVVGHSLGSQAATVAASQHADRVVGTVLVDFGLRERAEASPRRTFRHQLTYRSRDDAISRFALLPRQDCVNEFYLRFLAERSVRPVDDGRWGWHFDVAIFGRTLDRHLGDHLGAIAGPVAFLRGEDSALVPPSMVDRCLRQLGRPAPVVSVPTAGHHIWIDQPLGFVAALRGVLAAWMPRGLGS